MSTIFVDTGESLAGPPDPPRSAAAVDPELAPTTAHAIPQLARPATWRTAYLGIVLTFDLLAAIAAAAVAFICRFGFGGSATDFSGHAGLAIIFPVGWLAAVALNRGYDPSVFGTGPEEFRRVSRAFLLLITAIAITSYALKAELARGFVFVAMPLVLVLTLAERYAIRKGLHRRRTRGQSMASMLVVGHPIRVLDLAIALRRDSFTGMTVVGACVPSGVHEEAAEEQLRLMGIPVLGEIDDIQGIVRSTGTDVVAVTSSAEIAADKLRWIAWQLEGTNAELAVSPGLVDVAGTRINVRLAAGLPLVYVEAPRFSGPRRLLKGGFDRTVAAMALVLLSPLLLIVAAMVRFGSSGPAFFRQTRVGKNGQTFTMFKFRSMYTDAEARLAELHEHNANADGPLFKMRDDPRVTKIGRVLRRYSVDELPQLLNVLNGSMSLVGPRPALPREVDQSGADARRRLLVKPGLTGLWQVSGRSDLSWEDSVRLDLRYVENWSLAMDMMLLWKTARAVLGADGAY